ncbi:MAG TPA: prepilin-type N-terminal cleavage/methylation domain-containing protein [Lacipirellulaceae bacterium]|nr:prepilin-type N-terminal cleavage/methylation domain-containing protein [Lacipirellulaceae bacterium]
MNPRQSRGLTGFTLVELLIAITIISILASLILGVASVAGETARHRKTEQMIARLHTLLMEHYDTYKTRRVAVRQEILKGINDSTASAAQKGLLTANARLYALRELILMEVPDRWSDILLTDVPDPPTGLTDARYPFFQSPIGASPTGRTSLADVYLRRYAAIATGTNSLTGQTNTAEEITDNQGAECLYLVITLATGDGEARTLFGESTIGDTDGDGAKEFLDGWEHPINFLRWAPGFDSQIQLSAVRLNPPPLPANTIWMSAADNDHDPFDVYRVERPAFRLVPLIFSAGRDETFGIRLVKPHVALRGLRSPGELQQIPNRNNWPIILPWGLSEPDVTGDRVFLGIDSGEGASTDNIHNHLLGDR